MAPTQTLLPPIPQPPKHGTPGPRTAGSFSNAMPVSVTASQGPTSRRKAVDGRRIGTRSGTRGLNHLKSAIRIGSTSLLRRTARVNAQMPGSVDVLIPGIADAWRNFQLLDTDSRGRLPWTKVATLARSTTSKKDWTARSVRESIEDTQTLSSSDDSITFVQYAKFLEKQGQKDKAEVEFKKALEIKPNSKLAQEGLDKLKAK